MSYYYQQIKKRVHITDLVKAAGNYKVNFDVKQLSSGVYFYTLKAGDFVKTKKMLLIR